GLGGLFLRALPRLIFAFGFLDPGLGRRRLGVDRRQALLALGRDQIAELELGIHALLGIGLVDELVEAAGRAARTDRRAAHHPGPADGLVSDHAVVPGLVLGRLQVTQRLGDAITLG